MIFVSHFTPLFASIIMQIVEQIKQFELNVLQIAYFY
nr:MAG TPA: hypothetical protein [Caudoviricetes sp.]